LRGINAGGHRKISTKDFQLMFQELGATNVISYLHSANIIFENKIKSTSEISVLVSHSIKSKFNLEVPALTFTSEDLQGVIKDNPFVDDFTLTNLHVTFLSSLPDAEVINFPGEPDQFKITGRLVYINCEGKYHK